MVLFHSIFYIRNNVLALLGKMQKCNRLALGHEYWLIGYEYLKRLSRVCPSLHPHPPSLFRKHLLKSFSFLIFPIDIIWITTRNKLSYLHIVDLDGGSMSLPCEFTSSTKLARNASRKIGTEILEKDGGIFGVWFVVGIAERRSLTRIGSQDFVHF